MQIKRMMLLAFSVMGLFLLACCSAPQSNSFAGAYVGVHTGGTMGASSDNTNG